MVRVSLTCAAVVLLAVAAWADESGWEQFTSKEGRFAVSFPAAPKERKLKPRGEAIAQDVRFESKRDGVDYDVGYVAYAQAVADKYDALDPAEFAQRQREATVKGTKGKVLAQKDVTLGKEKRPGYELLIQVSAKGFIRQRAFYAHGRLYQLMVTGTSRDAVTGTTADKFLDSFRLAE